MVLLDRPSGKVVELVSREAAETPQERRVIFVGVGGSSGVGKSTMVEALDKRFHSPVTCLEASAFFIRDKFLKRYPEGTKDCIGSDINFTHPSSVNTERFKESLFEFENLFRFCRTIPKSHHLKGGNIIASEAQGQPLTFDRPVVIFIDGPTVFMHQELSLIHI